MNTAEHQGRNFLGRSLDFLMSGAVTPIFLAVSVLFFLADHLVFWGLACHWQGGSWAEMLTHWDSSYYNEIVLRGYTAKSMAFFPLYPMLVRLLHGVLAMAAPIPVQWVGTILSTVFFLLACILFMRLARKSSGSCLISRSRLGWLFFLFAPASFVFHSHHAESLFLLLSLLTFLLAEDDRWILASLFAGLCALTRIQGCFVGVAVAFMAYEGGRRLQGIEPLSGRARSVRGLGRFVASSIISGSLFLVYPLYQATVTGNPWSFVVSQADWNHPTSTLPIYLKAFVLGNPWQSASFGSLMHHVFVGLLVVAALLFRRNRAMQILIVLNLLVMPMEGEFVNAFRFGTVIFPALFVLGDHMREHRSTWACGLVLGAWWLLNHAVAWNYAIGRWAY